MEGRAPEASVASRRDTKCPVLQVVGIGAGRDGTSTLAALIAATARANSETWVVQHDLYVNHVCNLASLHLESGYPFYQDALRDLLGGIRAHAVVGTCYQYALNLLKELHGPSLKLIHLHRRNREENIRSLAYVVHYRPAASANLTPERPRPQHGEYAMRPCAWHYGEMTKPQWNRLELEERLAWHCAKSHAIVSAAEPEFHAVLRIATEDLSDERTLRALARFLDPAWTEICEPIRENSRASWEEERAKNERIRQQMLFGDDTER